MKKNNFIFSLFVYVLLTSFNSIAQLSVTTGASATTLAATLAGPSATVLTPVLTCPGVAEGTFTFAGTSPLSMSSGIVLTNGHAASCAGPEAGLVSFNIGVGTGDPLLAPYLPGGTATVDACYLDFDLVATGDTIGFNYQFGSEEYRNAVCSIYTDVFGFFISGPGITGTVNMATVPGTTIPVEINSINNGTPGTVGGAAIGHCTALGAGSPFTMYYIDNTGGPLMTYRGYTTKLRAAHAVTPCSTYHLHVTIEDAGNWQYDSGVFLEGGSLFGIGSYHFDHTAALGATINGVPNTIVKGCNSAIVNILGSLASPIATNLTLSFGGTAANGTDVSTVPTTVTMPIDSTHLAFNVSGLPTADTSAKLFTIYLHGPCGIIDSIHINLIDTPSAYILTADTTICSGQLVHIITTGTPGLSYNWAPGATLSSPTVSEPTATPSTTTIYTMTATLPGSGCPPIVRDLTINVSHDSVNIITPDTSVCAGTVLTLNVYATPGTTYSWTPFTGLSSSTILNPVVTPLSTTTYSISVTAAGGCVATDTVRITIIPGAVSITTPPTTICFGNSITLNATGLPGSGFVWTPATSLSNATIFDPIATPSVTTTYTVTGSTSGGLCPAVAFVTITVANPSVTILTPGTTICNGASITLNVVGNAGSTFSWTPTTGLSSSTILDPTVNPTVTTTYLITASVPGTTCIAKDSVLISVISDSLSVSPAATICTGDSIQLHAYGSAGMVYNWSPSGSLNNANSTNPVAKPNVSTVYTVVGTTSTGACPITSTIAISIASPAATILTPDTAICTGIPVLIRVSSSGTNNYNWSPTTGLSNPYIMDPVATPTTTTTYYDTISYPGIPSCYIVDSVTITIIPPLTVIAGVQVLSCNSGIQLQCQPGGVDYTYSWSGPNSFADSIQNPYIFPASSSNQGTYNVKVTDLANGCIGLDSATVSFDSTHTHHLTHVTPNMTIPYGTTVHLNADSEVYYWWRPANATINDANINNPFVTPTDSVTTYTVYGMDSTGCLDSAFVTINLTYSNIFIPSAFSPNGDGLNDVFRPVGFTYQHLVEMRIFNRWGEEVFFSNNVENGWNGTFKGVLQDMDTYYYVIAVAFPNGDLKYYKGDITLIR